MLNQAEFRAELAALASWLERAKRIDQALGQTRAALASRNEKLFDLRRDFDALTLDFWAAFARSLEADEKEPEKARTLRRLGVCLLVLAVFYWAVTGYNA